VTVNTLPRISIITATFNAAGQLPYTLRSIGEQTSREYARIVVDGNSTDGTRALLRENSEVITCWISGPDEGIYDAWNKACRMARGERVVFLGAGDELATPHTLAACIKELGTVSLEATLAYGRQTLLSPIERTPLETIGVPWVEIQDKWEIGRPALPPHGATFQRKYLFTNEQAFDLRFPITSDSHFLLRAIKHNAPVYIPIDVTRAPMGGVSFRLDTARQVGHEIAAINGDLGLTLPLAVKLHEGLRLAVIALSNMFLPRTAHRLANLIRQSFGQTRRWSIH
jgi:glycosyltransferase involved in cell wall biosynthesis